MDTARAELGKTIQAQVLSWNSSELTIRTDTFEADLDNQKIGFHGDAISCSQSIPVTFSSIINSKTILNNKKVKPCPVKKSKSLVSYR